MQDFSQATNADGTKLDIKDKDHGLCALMCCFGIYGVRLTVDGKRGSTIPKVSHKQQLLMTPNLI